MTTSRLAGAAIVALAFLLPALATAGVVGPTPPAPPAARAPEPTAFAANPPVKKLNWGEGQGKSWFLPAVELLGFQFTLNEFDRHFVEPKDSYRVTMNSVRENLHRRWIVDDDTFAVNEFGHPYQGNIYHNIARSMGQDFWSAMIYDQVGSAIWEIAGETTNPSINDQITTGFGGAFFGEPLFRMASLMLETGHGKPGFWRELGAGILSPPTGFNRAVTDRFDGVFPSYDPAVYTRVQAGASLTETARGRNADAQLKRHQPYAELLVDYGLPGKGGYEYKRPFDYFNFQLTMTPSNTFESIFSRGLLKGEAWSSGPDTRGLWGLFGTYDYVSPQLFRVGAVGAGLGAVCQWWISPAINLNGTALTGLSYAGGGQTRVAPGQRDFHYGLTPQEVLSVRLVFGSRMAWDVNLRDYYISSIASTETDGSENIARADSSITWRVYGLHGVTLRYAVSQREARYGNAPSQRQRVGTVSLAYTLLGNTRFGAVDWRPEANFKPPDKM